MSPILETERQRDEVLADILEGSIQTREQMDTLKKDVYLITESLRHIAPQVGTMAMLGLLQVKLAFERREELNE